MKLNRSFAFTAKVLMVFGLMVLNVACADENEFFEKPSPSVEAPVVEIGPESDVASVTISGIFTELVDYVDCATCTYTVPDNAMVVDGEDLGLKPGSVICLGKGRKLGEVEFLNMVGTEDKPITIGNCE